MKRVLAMIVHFRGRAVGFVLAGAKNRNSGFSAKKSWRPK